MTHNLHRTDKLPENRMLNAHTVSHELFEVSAHLISHTHRINSRDVDMGIFFILFFYVKAHFVAELRRIQNVTLANL